MCTLTGAVGWYTKSKVKVCHISPVRRKYQVSIRVRAVLLATTCFITRDACNHIQRARTRDACNHIQRARMCDACNHIPRAS